MLMKIRFAFTRFLIKLQNFIINIQARGGLISGARGRTSRWGGGEEAGGGYLINFCWVCAAGFSEPLSHCGLCCGHIIDPILVSL